MAKSVLILIEEDQDTYLKSKGINKSKFVRQAIESYKQGKWSYDYLE